MLGFERKSSQFVRIIGMLVIDSRQESGLCSQQRRKIVSSTISLNRTFTFVVPTTGLNGAPASPMKNENALA
jgi:hypothetical protein